MANHSEKVIVTVGPSDSGKSTWIHQAAQQIESEKICLISGDLGQAIFGAPGLLSAGVFSGQQYLSDIIPEKTYFVGENNPFGRFLQTQDGLTALTTFARKYAERVLIDTDGLIAGPAAREYKRLLLSNLAPADIVFFGRDPALDPLKQWCYARDNLNCYELDLSEAVSSKTQADRTKNRNEMLQDWFSDSEKYRIPLQEGIIYSNLTRLGTPVSTGEHSDIETILETKILYAEKSNSWLNILLPRRVDQRNVNRLFGEYSDRKVNLTQFSKWQYQLIGDFAHNEFSSGMGYISSYELDPPRLVVKGKFLREPGDTWMLGRGSYNPDEIR